MTASIESVWLQELLEKLRPVMQPTKINTNSYPPLDNFEKESNMWKFPVKRTVPSSLYSTRELHSYPFLCSVMCNKVYFQYVWNKIHLKKAWTQSVRPFSSKCECYVMFMWDENWLCGVGGGGQSGLQPAQLNAHWTAQAGRAGTYPVTATFVAW